MVDSFFLFLFQNTGSSFFYFLSFAFFNSASLFFRTARVGWAWWRIERSGLMRDGSGSDKIWLGSCGGFGGEEQITIWTELDHGARASRRRLGLDGVGLGDGNGRRGGGRGGLNNMGCCDPELGRDKAVRDGRRRLGTARCRGLAGLYGGDG